MSIQNAAMIASLSISQWVARRHDKEITKEVKNTHNAAEDAGRYNKLLVAKEHTEKLSKITTRARAFHYENTLPWGDNNERLLPTKNYFEYMNELGSLKSEFDSAVSEFIKNYPSVVEEARIRLNGMFKQADYPSALDIEHKFGFRTAFMPVPSSDFRVGLADTEVDKLRIDIESEINKRVYSAKFDIWQRINTQLSHMKAKLSDTEGVFRDSLFENLKELVELVPRLNLTDDADVNTICSEMSKVIADPQEVRANPNLRAEKAQEVTDILNKFEGWF